MNSVLILDPLTVKDFVSSREASGIDRFDEVWDGRLVVPAAPNNEHYRLSLKLTEVFSSVIDWDRGDQAVSGGNVSDRDDDWIENYRIPDGIVSLASGGCRDRDTHWFGPPDLLVEILSPRENPFGKFEFYSQIGTREVLLVYRYPWALEIFRLTQGKLLSVGRSELANPQCLESKVLPLTLRLTQGKNRPQIELVHAKNGQRWVV